MPISAFSSIGQAFDTGDVHYQYVTKSLTPNPSISGYFVDLNQSSGQPVYNAFAGTQGAFTVLEGSGNKGVYVGPTSSGKEKYLQRIQSLEVFGGTNYIYLCDYLGFYSLIDCDDLDVQSLDNTSTLTRYVDGKGVRISLVVQAPILNTAPFTIVYTNSKGVSGRSVTYNLINGVNIGVCATSSGNSNGANMATPFLPLAEGDEGVRSIESIQFQSSAGGFICACLVYPLAQMQVYEQNTPVEKVYGFDHQKLPKIENNAYLNFMLQRPSASSGSLRAELVFLNL